MEENEQKEIKILNRFTTLPVLIDLIMTKKLTLLDPKNWEDRNDAKVIYCYKENKKIINFFALCFTYETETIYHWKAFSNGPSGCVIEFNAQKLFTAIAQLKDFKDEKLRHGKINYKQLKDVEKKENKLEIDKLPFTKRWPYRNENEYRIIYEDKNNSLKTYKIEIDLDIINRITFNQQMPEPIFKSVKDFLEKEISKEIKIHHSTLEENKRWIKALEKNN